VSFKHFQILLLCIFKRTCVYVFYIFRLWHQWLTASNLYKWWTSKAKRFIVL